MVVRRLLSASLASVVLVRVRRRGPLRLALVGLAVFLAMKSLAKNMFFGHLDSRATGVETDLGSRSACVDVRRNESLDL